MDDVAINTYLCKLFWGLLLLLSSVQIFSLLFFWHDSIIWSEASLLWFSLIHLMAVIMWGWGTWLITICAPQAWRGKWRNVFTLTCRSFFLFSALLAVFTLVNYAFIWHFHTDSIFSYVGTANYDLFRVWTSHMALIAAAVTFLIVPVVPLTLPPLRSNWYHWFAAGIYSCAILAAIDLVLRATFHFDSSLLWLVAQTQWDSLFHLSVASYPFGLTEIAWAKLVVIALIITSVFYFGGLSIAVAQSRPASLRINSNHHKKPSAKS
jgi:hypothetical protein